MFDIKKVSGNLPDGLELPFSQLTVQIHMVQGKLPLKFMCIKKKNKPANDGDLLYPDASVIISKIKLVSGIH